MNITVVLQAIVGGLLIGSIYTLITLGYTLTLGVLNFVNFAQGQLTMISMYISVILFQLFGVDPFIAMPVNVVICFCLGLLLYESAIKFAVPKTHSTQIIVTIGLSLMLENIILFIFGGNIQSISTTLTATAIRFGSISLSKPKVIAFAITMVMLVLLNVLLKKTSFGKKMRAIADNKDGAYLVGTDVKKIYRLVFGLSAALEGVAGAAMISFIPTYPSYGNSLGMKAFLIVVIGGMGSVPGAILGGLLIGVIETFSSVLFTGSYAGALTYGLLVLVLIFMPNGLFYKLKN